MCKLLPATLIIYFLFLSLISHCQQPVIEVKSFEYTWNSDAASRVILALDDSVKLCIKNSFAKAIKERWNLTLPEVSFSTKRLSFLASTPKFKTQLKDRMPGKWYLFLQVFENTITPGYLLEEDAISTVFELKCRIVSSANDSVIIDRALIVNIHDEPSPPDQVQLKRLPAFPASFVKSFDTIATWLFLQEPVSQKSLKLKPAYIFQPTILIDKPLNKSLFQKDLLGIHHLTAPEFSFQASAPKVEKTGIKRNVGGRSIGGAFTLLTGVSSSKTKSYEYKADYPFRDNDSTYHCFIGYTEYEMASRERVRNSDGSVSMQSTDYKFFGRYTNPHSLHFITLGADTLATFNLTNIIEAASLTSYNQMWDGRDSTTIVRLPPDCNNKVPERDLVISGKMGGISFNMKTLKGKRIKDFYINDQLVATILGQNEPVNAYIFQPISTRQLKLFTILSSLPFSYFCGPFY